MDHRAHSREKNLADRLKKKKTCGNSLPIHVKIHKTIFDPNLR